MTELSARDWIGALRRSHDRLDDLVRGLDEPVLSARSYDADWSIAQVLSHLGSGSEIFGLILDAGIAGEQPPGGEVLQGIWAEWDARSPEQMRDGYLVSGEAFVRRLESMTDEEIGSFSLPLWGMVLDVPAFARMRLSELAVHVWDVEVALDPTALVTAEAVGLLLDGLGSTAERSGTPADPPFAVQIVTTDPARDLVVRTASPVTIEVAEEGASYDGRLVLPAEAFLRLVYGRLDEAHAPELEQAGARGLDDLRAAFPGF